MCPFFFFFGGVHKHAISQFHFHTHVLPLKIISNLFERMLRMLHESHCTTIPRYHPKRVNPKKPYLNSSVQKGLPFKIHNSLRKSTPKHPEYLDIDQLNHHALEATMEAKWKFRHPGEAPGGGFEQPAKMVVDLDLFCIEAVVGVASRFLLKM